MLRQGFGAFILISAFLLPAGSGSAPQAGTAALQFWPTWRGPLATGVSPTADPPVTWSETENVKWKVKVPSSGSSSPIIWKDRIYLLTAVPSAKAAAPAPGNEVRTVALTQEPERPRGQRRGGFGGGAAPT